MATTMIVSSLPEQTVFCSIDSVRRHCWGRYRKHEFDNYVYVGYDDIVPMVRASCPKGVERFLINPHRKAHKGADDIGKGISDARATEDEWRPQGSRC